MSQTKGHNKTPEKQLNETEIGNIPQKEFRMISHLCAFKTNKDKPS